MSEKLLRKALVFGIICLFIGASACPVIYSKEPRPASYQFNNDDGLVGYWDFNEGEGNIVEDKSQYNNHGEIYGASWYEKGIQGTALYFDGDWDYVLIQDDESLNFEDTNSFTLDVWIKWDGVFTTHQSEFIIHKLYYNGYELRLRNPYGNIGFTFGEKNNEIGLLSKTTMDTNWHRITAIWDGHTAYLYIDGVLDNSSENPGYLTKDSEKPLEIGNNWGYTDNLNTFKGVIDEVKIYEKAVFPMEKPAKPSIITPSDEEIVKGNVLIYGSVNEISEKIIGVEISINGTDDWKIVNGTHWLDSYLWDHSFSTLDYNTGNLTIYARSFKNQVDEEYVFSDIEQVEVHVDNHEKLPDITIFPKDENFISDIIEIEGMANDSDGHIVNVQIKINDREWEDVYKMLPNWRSDKWDTTKEDDGTYYIYARCQDNESYWSPVKEIEVTVDNHIPEIDFVMPKENHLYLFWKFTKFDRDTSSIPFFSKTMVIGKLPAQIQILSNYDWVSKNQTKLYLNDIDTGYRFDAVSNTFCFENEQWNYQCFGKNCTLMAVVPNINFHVQTSKIYFTYWNFVG